MSAVSAGRVIAANAKASARADVALPRALITSAPDITEFDLPPADSPKFSGLIHYESATVSARHILSWKILQEIWAHWMGRTGFGLSNYARTR